MSKKLTIEEVCNKFKEKNRELLEFIYSKNTQRLRYKCLNCSREDTCSIVGLKQVKSGCKGCNESVKARSYTQEEIEEIYRKQGCEFRDVFITIRDKGKYKCSCGNIDEGRIEDFLRGHRCKKCWGQKISNSLKVTEKDIVEVCEENGCQLIDTWLEKSGIKQRTKINFKCKCGNEHISWWYNFVRLPNCSKCGNERKSGTNCYRWNPDREVIKRRKNIQKRCYNLIKRTLNAFNKTKNNYKSEILGYSVQELYDRIYLEHSQFDFNQKWDIDHIFPVQAFVDHGIDDMKLINHLSNLRPLPEKENLEKANKYNKHKFSEWLESINKI